MRRNVYLYNSRFLFFVSFVVSAILNTSCADCQVKEKIIAMQSEPIALRTDKMLCISEKDESDIRGSLKWIVYHDSVICKPCQISHLSDWDKILDTEGVNCYFIFSAKPEEVGKYVDDYQNNKIDAHVYLDTANIFVHDNPKIPRETIFHDFLVDEDNSVILVGNPINNKQVLELFKKIVEERKMSTKSKK